MFESAGRPNQSSVSKEQETLSYYQAIDELLYSIEQKISFLDYIQPQNLAEAFDAFIKDPETEPDWKYPDVPEVFSDYLKELDSLTISGDRPYFRGLFQEKQRDLSLFLRFLMERGDREQALAISKVLYGVPSQALTEEADRILKQPFRTEEVERNVSSEVLKGLLEESLRGYQLHEWEVHWYSRPQLSVDPSCRRVFLHPDRMYSEQDCLRLCVHEIGVHALRAENGYQQAFRFFATGFPGYEVTEEGLATYAEECSKTSSPHVLRRYAARVLAVDSLAQGHSFSDTVKRLSTEEYGLSVKEAFQCSVRAFRGGGLTKDYIYLDGLMKVKAFVAAGGDVRSLFIGKIGIEHLEVIPKLAKEFDLKEPQQIPEVFRSSDSFDTFSYETP